MADVADVASRGAQKAASSAPLRIMARTGYAVNGIVHVLIGLTAIGVAVGTGGKADQSGALGELAAAPGGRLLLWAIALALFALALWQILNAILRRDREAKRRWAQRLAYLAKGFAYLVVGVTALTFARGSSSSSTASSQTLSAQVLSLPGGWIVLVLVGLAVCAIGIAFFVRGLTRRFLKRIRVPGGALGRLVTVLGVVGYAAEGVALTVVGILFLTAAATLDPTKATGLDGALRALATVPFGEFILVIVGAGFIAFGLYSGFRARLARL